MYLKLIKPLLTILLAISFLIYRPQITTAQSYTWKNVTIRGGGFVTGIVTHPGQPNLVYARTDVGGAYRWDNASSCWTPLTDWVGYDNYSWMGIESIAIDPSDTSRLYIAAGMYTKSWPTTNGAIFCSTNQGNTFQRSDLPFKLGGNEDGRTIGERLMVDPNYGSTLYFGTRTCGLWKSTDYAVTWNRVTSFPVTGYPNGVGIGWVVFDSYRGTTGKPSPTIYVGVADTTGNTIYRSTDSGTTWSAVPGQPGPNLLPHHAVLDSDGTLYITFSNIPGPNNITAGAVWKYNTHRGIWTNITPPVGEGGFGGISVDVNHQGTVMVGTMDRWVPHDEIYRSIDKGSTWVDVWGQTTQKIVWDLSSSPYGTSESPDFMGDMEIDPHNSNIVYFITGFGIFRGNDVTAIDSNPNATTHWEFFNNGLEETCPWVLISPPSGPHLVSAVADVDGFEHNDLDNLPTNGRLYPYMGSNNCIDFAQNSPNMMVRVGGSFWRTSAYGYYSLDNGVTWTGFTNRPSGASNGWVAISADGRRIVWSPSNAPVSYSTTTGKSWTSSIIGTSGGRLISDRVNSNKFYLYEPNSGVFYLSTDGGASFSPFSTGLDWAQGMMAVPGFEGNIWLAHRGGLYRSIDSGSTFSRFSSVQSAYAVGFGKASTGLIHPTVFLWGKVNNIFGFFRSDDIGTTWLRINDDQHQYGEIVVVIGDPRVYGRIYIGTSGRGIIYGDITVPIGTNHRFKK